MWAGQVSENLAAKTTNRKIHTSFRSWFSSCPLRDLRVFVVRISFCRSRWSRLPEAQHEPIAGAAAFPGGARRIVPIPGVVLVAQEIGFAIQYEPRCQHFGLDDIFFNAVERIGHFDTVPGSRAVIDNHKDTARLECSEHGLVHGLAIHPEPDGIVI